MHCEAAERGHEPRNADTLQELKKAAKCFLSQNRQIEHNSANTFILAL